MQFLAIYAFAYKHLYKIQLYYIRVPLPNHTALSWVSNELIKTARNRNATKDRKRVCARKRKTAATHVLIIFVRVLATPFQNQTTPDESFSK